MRHRRRRRTWRVGAALFTLGRAHPLRVAIVAAVVAVLAGGLYAAVSHARAPLPQPSPDALIPRPGSYLGVSEANESLSYGPVNKFAVAAGRQPNIVLFYGVIGSSFQQQLAERVYAHHAVPFVQISPGKAPMSAVAAGRYDTELRSYADQVRAFGHPVIIGFSAEMNGTWYPWGWRHTRPATWIAAWRHVVTVFRQEGASKVCWLWTVSVSINGTGPIWQWWPGARYVTWIGIDGYYYYKASTFASVFGPTITQVRAITHKPVLLSEAAIGQVAGQAAKIPDLFAGIRAAELLGLVWFDHTQHGSPFHQDWRLEGHPAAVRAFREAVRAYGP